MAVQLSLTDKIKKNVLSTYTSLLCISICWYQFCQKKFCLVNFVIGFMWLYESGRRIIAVKIFFDKFSVSKSKFIRNDGSSSIKIFPFHIKPYKHFLVNFYEIIWGWEENCRGTIFFDKFSVSTSIFIRNDGSWSKKNFCFNIKLYKDLRWQLLIYFFDIFYGLRIGVWLGIWNQKWI